MTCAHASAANFVSATYDPRTDELVVTLTYRGTNPNHEFTLQWDKCRSSADGRTYEIAARVLDTQWRDRARESFSRTVRFPLADLTCRPAAVTLLTEPRFRINVNVPARGDAERDRRDPRTEAQ